MDNNRYLKGKIYKIVDNTNNNIYIGSTCEPTLAHRLAKHIQKYKRFLANKNIYGYTRSLDILKNNNYDIVLIENFPCSSKDELHKRERYFIETIPCINLTIPTRTTKEYRIANKEKIKIFKQEKYKINKDKIKEKVKQIGRCTCECGGHYTYGNKDKHLKTNKHISFNKNLIVL